MKRFLAIAACIAVLGNTDISAYSTTTVTLSSGESATADAGILEINGPAQSTQVWKLGDDKSVNISLQGGTLDISRYTAPISNDIINAISGTLNLNNGILSIRDGSSITKAVNTTVANNSLLNILGGNVTLDADDNLNGNINIFDGNLTLVGITKSGSTIFTQTSGSTTINGKNFNLNNENDSILGGSVIIGNGINSSKLTVSQGAISSTALNIKDRSSLDITGGFIDLDSTSTLNGGINISGGELTLSNVTKGTNSTFKQTNGKTTVTGTNFNLDNSDDIISGGIFNIGNKTTTTQVNVSQGHIKSTATVNINRNGKLNITGGEVELNNGDTWDGDLNISDGILSITDINKKSNATFIQTGGYTTIDADQFDINNNSDKISNGTLDIKNGTTLNVSAGSIDAGAVVKLNNGTTTNLSGGSLYLDNTDTWNGSINVSSGNLNLIGITNKKGILTQTNGITTITQNGLDLNNTSDKISGGTLNIGDTDRAGSLNVSKGTINGNSVVNINNSGTLNLTGGNVSLNSNTLWDGAVNVSSGTLNIDSATKNANGVFSQSNGSTTITGTRFNLNNATDNVAGGTFNIGNGTTLTTVEVSQGTIYSGATTNVNSNATLNVSGGQVTLDNKDTWNGNVNVSGGSLALIGITKSNNATLKQTAGTTTISDTVFELNNTNDLLNDGILNIGTNSTTATLNVTKGTVDKNAITNLALGSTINIDGGNVTLDSSDIWDGNVKLGNGSLKLTGITKNPSGTYAQSGGNLTVTNTIALNNSNDIISGGNVNIGTATDTGTLEIQNGIIETGANIDIASNGTLDIKGGTTNIDADDRWDGEIKVSNGTLNLVANKTNIRTTSSAKFNQTGGITNIDDSKLSLDNANSKITGGIVNLTSTGELNVNNASDNTSELNSTGGTFTLGSGSKYTITNGTIDETSKINLTSGSTFILSGENTNVTLDGANDTFDGHLALANGTLNLKNGIEKTTSATGIYVQSGGIANISGNSSLTLNESGSTITGGTVNVTEGSKLSILNGQNNSSALNVTGSKLTLKNNSSYTTTDGIIDPDSVVEIEADSKLSINGTTAKVNLTKNDKTNGHIEVTDGNLYISDDLTKVTTSSGTFVQTGGNTTLNNSSLVLADANSVIAGGILKLQDGSTLTFTTNNPAYQGGNMVIDDTSVMNYLAENGLIQISEDNQINIDTSGLINMANNVRTNNVINNLTINNGEFGGGVANFAIDISARSNAQASTDTITANLIRVATNNTEGTIRISDYNFGGDIFGYDAPIDRSIRLGKIFQTDDLGKEVTFTATDKEVFTPIGYYKLNPSATNDGSYSLDLTRFNPEVYRGQVSNLASYMNQLAFNDTLFNRAHIRHFASNGNQMLKNKSAVIDGNASYEKTLRDGQIWTEVYGNLETLKVNTGINKVKNSSWGFIVGGDFGLRDLKNGWSWMPTAYIAYNGGHQTYNRVGMWQNGAQTGFMGTFIKDKAMHSALAYVGVYDANIDVAGFSEDAFNYFLGLATKSSYDWKVGTHFKVQPNLTLAYNLFGQQNWHSNYGQMSMSAGFLNGFNIAPGMNFVIDHENWSTYATVAYAWNFIPDMGGEAGNVGLSNIEMKNGYVQYGVGFTRSFSDNFNMYGQATIRDIGRIGVIFQGGMNWRL